MVIRFVAVMGVEGDVLTSSGDLVRGKSVVVDDIECTDIANGLSQWQNIHSGTNTIPTSQIVMTKVLN